VTAVSGSGAGCPLVSVLTLTIGYMGTLAGSLRSSSLPFSLASFSLGSLLHLLKMRLRRWGREVQRGEAREVRGQVGSPVASSLLGSAPATIITMSSYHDHLERRIPPPPSMAKAWQRHGTHRLHGVLLHHRSQPLQPCEPGRIGLAQREPVGSNKNEGSPGEAHFPPPPTHLALASSDSAMCGSTAKTGL
jgi:hypothetical protein